MLSLNDLLKFAETENIPLEKRRGIVREYLQTLILFYLQKNKYAGKMIFIGGTALRFFYNLQRFSKDLDFNFQGILKKEDLEKLMKILKRELKKENIEIKFSIHKSTETYFHWKIYLQFENVLQFYECAGKQTDKLHPKEQLSIQLDFQNLGKDKYPITSKVISRFGKRFLFNTANLDMFLAEKSNAILFRKSPRARDLFDFMSLINWGASLNFAYLKIREVNVKNKDEFIDKIQKRIKSLDLKKLTKQLEPFLFQEEDKKIMENFGEYIGELMYKSF